MEHRHDTPETGADIIELYWARDEEAIRRTAETYGGYCYTVAYNVLGNAEDAEECVNDAYLAVWNAIPPARPASLKQFLTRILRNLALNRYKEQHRDKRGGGQVPLALEELSEGGLYLMKTMDLLTLLGELDEEAVQAPAMERKKTKNRILWGAVACLCACMLGFSAWFFLPPTTVTSNDQRIVVIRIDDHLVSYEILKTNTMSRFERTLLPDEPGEVLAVHGDSTFYRPAGEEDLVYLIQIDSNGKQTILEFYDYVNTAGVDMTTSYWYTSGWLSDEDIRILESGKELLPWGDILETIYSVSSAQDIASVRFSKSGSDNSSVGASVRVKTVTVKDAETLKKLYDLFPRLHVEGYRDEPPIASVHARDEAYINGERPLSVQINRTVTLTLTSGRELTVTYYPSEGVLKQNSTGYYTILPEAENEWLIALAEIDMEWHDWGTEEEHDYGGEGNETATSPAVPDPQ